MSSFLRRQAIKFYESANGRHVLKNMAELERTQWLSRSEILDYQQKKLHKLLTYAYEFVPFHRQAFDEVGFKPDDILTDMTSFQKIPLISKSIVNENFEALTTTDASRLGNLSRNSTGGSTGVPLNFMQDNNYRDYVTADYHRHMQWTGWKFGETHAYIWGADYEVATQQAMRTRLMDWALDRFLVNAFTLNEETMSWFAEQVRKKRPKLIFFYPSAAERFANFVREKNLKDIKFVGGISSAELLYPPQRQLIEETFDCKVLDRYATRELGGIGCESPAQTGYLLVSAENVYIEVLKDDDTPAAISEEGNIVVTNLNNYGMPFIRYKVGDLGQLTEGASACGRGLPMMKVVQGRVTDMFKTKDGKQIHGEFFTHLFYGVTEVERFQVVQKDYDRIVVNLVEKSKLPQERKAFLERAIKDVMDQQVKVEFEVMDEIPLKNSGKYRFTISEVQ